MESPRRKNQECLYCRQELSHAAYYRHLDDKNGLVCPGRSAPTRDIDCSSEYSPDSDIGELSVSDHDPMSDTSFDLESSLNSDIADSPANSDVGPSLDDHYSGGAESSESAIETAISDSDTSRVEIWEESGEEDDTDAVVITDNARLLSHGITLFLTAIQLFFRLSERAMLNFLVFLRLLFVHFSLILHAPIFDAICRLLPKTMRTSRKHHIDLPKGTVIDYA